MFVLETNIIRFKTENQVTFQAAREHIYRAMPETVKKVPKLQKRKTTTTAASITATGPTIKPVQTDSHAECHRKYNEVCKELKDVKTLLQRALSNRNDDSDSKPRKHVTNYQKAQNQLRFQRSFSTESIPSCSRSLPNHTVSVAAPIAAQVPPPPKDGVTQPASPTPSSSASGFSDALKSAPRPKSPESSSKQKVLGRDGKPVTPQTKSQQNKSSNDDAKSSMVTLVPKQMTRKATLDANKLKSSRFASTDNKMEVDSALKRGRSSDSDEEQTPKKLMPRDKVKDTSKPIRQIPGKANVSNSSGKPKFSAKPITHK